MASAWSAPTFSPLSEPAAVPVPIKPVRVFDFSDFQAANPLAALPGDQIDAEVDRTNAAAGELIDRLALIQRDDGALLNQIVTYDSLEVGLKSDIQAEVAAIIEANVEADAARAEAAAALADARAATLPLVANGLPNQVLTVNPDNLAFGYRDALLQSAADPLVLEAGARRIGGLGAPVDPGDAATKGYVDGEITARAMVVQVGDPGAWDARNLRIGAVANPLDGGDVTTKDYVDTSIAIAGGVPQPVAGDENKMLTATGPAVFSWQAFLTDWISDATAYMRGLLKTINDAAGFRAAIDVPATADLTATNDQVTANAALAAATDADLQQTKADYLPKTGGVLTGNLTVPSLNDGPLAGLRNKIINGGFEYWQRGTNLVASTPWYTADRWLTYPGTGGTGTASYTVYTPGTGLSDDTRAFLRYQQTAGSTAAGNIQQRIENVWTLANRAVTLSFYAKVASGTLDVTPRLVQEFGTGGAPSARVEVFGAVKTLTNQWQRFTETFQLPSLAGKTVGTNFGDNYLAVILALPTATVFTIDLANVQLEEGPIATPFEQRPRAVEALLCQRYFSKNVPIAGSGYASAVGQSERALANLTFPAEMRVPPGWSYDHVAGGSVSGSLAASFVNSRGLTGSQAATATGSVWWRGLLHIDAEL